MAMTTALLSDVGVIIADGDKDLLAGDLLGISLSLPQIYSIQKKIIYFFNSFHLSVGLCGYCMYRSIVEILIHFIFNAILASLFLFVCVCLDSKKMIGNF